MIFDTLPYAAEAGRYDEVLDPDGRMRPAWVEVERALGRLDGEALHERRRRVDRMLDAEGAGYLVHDLALEDRPDRHGHDVSRRVESHPWSVDPLPYIIDAVEFDGLAAGVMQRVRLLEAVLADLYGRRMLMQSGIVAPSVVAGSPRLRLAACGAPAPSRWLVTAAVDVARDASGMWGVIQDLTAAPSGLGYSLLDRSVVARVSGAALRLARVAPVNEFTTAVRRALTAVAPRGRRSPRTVLLTGGPSHPTYVEHSYLAAQLGYHLVEAGDVVMRNGQLWLRAIHGLEPLDVVYRRLDDDRLDPLEPGSAGPGGVPGLAWGAWRGGVAVANAYGSALAEERELWPALPAAAEYLLGEKLVLPMHREGTLLGTAPIATTSGGLPLVSAAIVVRLQVVVGPDGIEVMPGGSARVLAQGDDPRDPSAKLVKDVWVVGAVPPLRLALRQPAPPQVDFSASVSKRAADALFWLGRAAERAEVAARAVRVVGAQLDQDPTLFGEEGDVGVKAVLGVLGAASGLATTESSGDLRADIVAELHRTTGVIVDKVAALVTEAMSVREYMSTMTGRLLGRLMRARRDLQGAEPMVDDLDAMLVDLTALSGLATESLVRGPAWRFLDLGRRIERSFAVLAGVEAALVPELDPMWFQSVCNIELSINESLVAYRRQHRSDVDLRTVFSALVNDDSNPRSLAFQLDRIREHVAGLGWPEGAALVDRLAGGALLDIDNVERGARRTTIAEFVLAERGILLDLAATIVSRWFADPVNPRRVRGA